MQGQTSRTRDPRASSPHDLASVPESPYPPLVGDETVAIVDGYGVALRVSRGHLLIRDGVGRHRRERRFSRATCPLRRLLILGHSGSLSLEAVRWCSDVGVHVAQLDHDGRVLVTSARRDVGAARVRRVQALASLTSLGVELTCDLLGQKIDGQANVALTLPGHASVIAAIRERADEAKAASTVETALDAEAIAARGYWEALAPLPVRFATRDRARVPDHWRMVGQRASLRSGDKRKAITPAHAIFNYLYRLLEVETTISLHAAGLDPSLGIFHRDERYRDSLALDVMEAARASVDAYVVRLLRDRTFTAREFHETETGVVRLLPPLTHELAGLMPDLGRAVEPVVLRVARMLDREPRIDAGYVTFAKPRRSEHKRATTRLAPNATPTPNCRGCGTPFPRRRGSNKVRYCPDCRDAGRANAFAAFVSKGNPATLAKITGIGDPSHDAETSRKRRAALSQRATERKAWNAANPARSDPAWFLREITPKLNGVTASELSRVTGLSRRYCTRVRDERLVPHESRWNSFKTLADSTERS